MPAYLLFVRRAEPVMRPVGVVVREQPLIRAVFTVALERFRLRARQRRQLDVGYPRRLAVHRTRPFAGGHPVLELPQDQVLAGNVRRLPVHLPDRLAVPGSRDRRQRDDRGGVLTAQPRQHPRRLPPVTEHPDGDRVPPVAAQRAGDLRGSRLRPCQQHDPRPVLRLVRHGPPPPGARSVGKRARRGASPHVGDVDRLALVPAASDEVLPLEYVVVLHGESSCLQPGTPHLTTGQLEVNRQPADPGGMIA